jgi:anti-sigma factor RsiW
MMKEVNAPNCGRENDLVAFLYGELNDDEKKSFESHVPTCRLCQAQTSEFRSIRESVAAWRDESLGRAQIASAAPAALMNPRQTSGLAAMRAFFDLSPLWMKGAVGFAAILFCIFTVLAVARLRPTPVSVATMNGNSQAHSQQEMNALVERRVQEEIARRKSSEEPPVVSPAVAVKQRTVPTRSRSAFRPSYEVASGAQNEKARRPLSKTEREQLAADLRLISSSNERGVELIDDQINQP